MVVLGVGGNYGIVQRECKELGATFANIYAYIMKADVIKKKRSSYTLGALSKILEKYL